MFDSQAGVVLYTAWLPDEPQLDDAATAILSSQEFQRAMGLRRGRSAFVLGRIMLRHAVAEVLGTEPRAVRLAVTPLGQPFVADADVSVSVSHSGCRVCVAVSRSGLVGVDVERLRPVRHPETLLCHVLGRPALGSLPGWGDGPDHREVLRIWVVRESVLKAVGEGLHRPLSHLVVRGSPPLWRVTVPDRAGTAPLHVRELDVGAGYVAALATQRHHVQVCVVPWTRPMNLRRTTGSTRGTVTT